MADTVTDILQTRLDLANLGPYEAGMDAAAGANLKFGRSISTVTGLVAGIAGIGASFGFVKDAVKAAAESQAGYERDARNFKGAFPIADLQEWANTLQDQVAVDDDVIAGMAGIAGSFQLTRDQAKGLVAASLNATESLKALGVDGSTLINQVGKAIQNNATAGLTRWGIGFDEVAFKAADTAGKVAILEEALNRQGGSNAAAAWAQTTEGRMAALGLALQDLQKDFGNTGLGITSALAGPAKGAIDAFVALPGPIKTVAYLVGVAIPAGMGVLSVASSIATIRQASLTASLVEETVALNATTAATGRLAAAQGSLGSGGAATGGKRSGFNGKTATAVGLADFALQFLPDDFAGGAGRAAKNIGNGAAIGAGIGSFIPGIGTGIGAAIGGGLGAASNLLPRPAEKDEAAEAMKQVAANTAKIAANTDPSKLPLSTSVVPGARQYGALELRKLLT